MSFLKGRFYVGMFLILTLALWSLPTTALADSGTATVSLNAGALTETGDFSQARQSVGLDGQDYRVGYTLGIQITDATGSGAGWNLQISGTPLSDGVNGHPALSQAVVGFAFLCEKGSSCTPPIDVPVPFPVAISNTPAKFFPAAPNTGMGVIHFGAGIAAFIPGSAFAGTYTSTLTLAIVSGP